MLRYNANHKCFRGRVAIVAVFEAKSEKTGLFLEIWLPN